MKNGIVSIDGMAFPDSDPHRRIAPPRCKVTDPTFWDGYDSKTLFYMAIFNKNKQELTLFAPPLLNFHSIALSGRYSIDGVALSRPKYRKGYMFDRLIFRCKLASKLLQVDIDGFSAGMPITETEPELFAGSKLVYTLSRNNELTWVRDWLHWNHKVHGADAVLFVDNASTAYGTEELAATIASVPGYRSALVVSVPFKFGPGIGTGFKSGDGNFLQTALMNAFWHRYMSTAKAMLNVDIDELMIAPNGLGIFDAVLTAPWGIVMASGTWRYAQQTMSAYRHADHFYKIENDIPCPPKYCVRPDSVAGRRILKLHAVKNFKRVPFVDRSTWYFLHCRNVSTSWKYDRNQIDTSILVEDHDTRNTLLSVFG